MDRLADHALLHHLASLVPGRVGHVLGSDLDDPLEPFDLVGHLLGQFELAPMAERLLDVDVLARDGRVDNLLGMVMVRRGDHDDVHLLVGQEFVMAIVGLGVVGLRRLFQPGPIDITDGHDVQRRTLLLEVEQRADQRVAAPAAADQPDADPLAGAEHTRLKQRLSPDRRVGRGHPRRRHGTG